MDKSKPKRRSSEKRRLKAKECARMRRDVETELLNSLVQLLPLETQSVRCKYVQALRITIALIHLCDILLRGSKSIARSTQKPVLATRDPSILDAIHGFFIIVSSTGSIIFVTHNITRYLGISQTDLLGSSLYDYLHQCDVKEARSILTAKTTCNKEFTSRKVSFLCRFKCTLTDRGTLTSLKSASHRAIQFTGQQLSIPRGVYVMALCEPIDHPTNIEIPLDRWTFLSRHDPSMIFTYCDDRMKDLVGFTSSDVLGRSVYQYHHACDSHVILKAHNDLFSKGQSVSDEYRFLVKHGGYVQIISQSTIIYHDYSHTPRCVISVYFLLSSSDYCDNKNIRANESISGDDLTTVNAIGVQSRDAIISHVQVPAKPLTNSLADNRTTANRMTEHKTDNSELTIDIPISSSKQDEQKVKQAAHTTELMDQDASIVKMALRAPTIPKGQDVKLWSKIPKYGIFGGMKLPVGATSSVITLTEEVLSPAVSMDDSSDDGGDDDDLTPPLIDLGPCNMLYTTQNKLVLSPGTTSDLDTSPDTIDLDISRPPSSLDSSYFPSPNRDDPVHSPTVAVPLDIPPPDDIFDLGLFPNSSPVCDLATPAYATNRAVSPVEESSDEIYSVCKRVKSDKNIYSPTPTIAPQKHLQTHVSCSMGEDSGNHHKNMPSCHGNGGESMLKHLLLYGTMPTAGATLPHDDSTVHCHPIKTASTTKTASTETTCAETTYNKTTSHQNNVIRKQCLNHCDYEIYAPTQTDELLYGQELLDALDT